MRLLFLCPDANSHAFGSSRLPKEGAVDNRLRKRAPCGARLLDTASMTGGRLGDRTTRPIKKTAGADSLGNPSPDSLRNEKNSSIGAPPLGRQIGSPLSNDQLVSPHGDVHFATMEP